MQIISSPTPAPSAQQASGIEISYSEALNQGLAQAMELSFLREVQQELKVR